MLTANRCVIACLVYLLCCASAAGETSGPNPDRRFHDFVKDEWSLESGLPQRSVHAIAQGPQGYIWIGTQHGLARFDGIEFTVFNSEIEPALPGNEITELFLDSRRRLWVGTYKGMAVYREGRFESVEGPNGRAENSGDPTVLAIAEDRDGRILVGSEEGLFQIEDQALDAVSEFHSEMVGALFREDDVLWIGGLGRYWRLEGKDWHGPWSLPTDAETAQVNGFARHDGELWLATSAGMFRHGAGEPEAFIPQPWLEGRPINALQSDSQGSLWVGTDSALLRIQNATVTETIDAEHPNTHPQVRSLFEDEEGNLWLGSNVEGVARYWSGWVDRFNEAQGLNESLIWSIADAGDGALWVGTADGLALLSENRYANMLSGGELPHPHAYTLLPEGRELWIGTRRGMTLMDVDDGELNQPDSLRELDPVQINGIVHSEAHERYFLATGNGLYSLHEEGSLEHLDDSIGNLIVRQVHIEADGTLVVATENGLFRGHPESLQRLDDDHGLDPEADYTAIHRLDRETLVVVTLENGLFVSQGLQFRHLSTSRGLPSNSHYYVTDDGRENLWVSGFEGLFHIPLDQVHEFARGDIDRVNARMVLSESGQHRGSQQGYCCNGAGHAKGLLREDGLWLPSRDGVVRLRPEDITHHQSPPKVHIERIRFESEWHRVQPDEPLDLPLGARDLAFDFTALNFRDPESVRIQYRLAGYDESWQELENVDQRMAMFTNLPPGSYRFQVRAANHGSPWTENPATQAFAVPARFHETPWFIALLVGAGLAVILAGYGWRRRQWRVNQETLKQEVRQRTEELRITNQQLIEANQALQKLSMSDSLTGLRNRRYLYEQMATEQLQLDRMRERAPDDDLVLGFALVDVDHFKPVNDERGHHVGDFILQELGERLRQFARASDYVARWGGEEFLVVFRGLPRAQCAQVAADLARHLSSKPYRLDDGTSLSVTCSVGFSEMPLAGRDRVGGLSWETAVEIADHALYQVKRNGRDGWALLRPGADVDTRAMLRALRNDIDGAIAAGDAVMISSWQGQVPGSSRTT